MTRTICIVPRAALPLLLALGACDVDISSATLFGSVGGDSWQFEEGEGWISSDGEFYTAELYAEYYAACFATPGGNYLSLRIPAAVGTYDLAAGEFEAEFRIDEPGLTHGVVPDSGTLEVRELGSDTLEGAVDLRQDGDHDVEGKFTLVLCQ